MVIWPQACTKVEDDLRSELGQMSGLTDQAVVVHLYPSAEAWAKVKSILISYVFGSLILRKKGTA